MGWLCGVGVFRLVECPHELGALHYLLYLIIIIIIITIIKSYFRDGRPRASGPEGVEVWQAPLRYGATTIHMVLAADSSLAFHSVQQGTLEIILIVQKVVQTN